MSSESFAITRKSQAEELRRLAEEHFQHDLQPQDRDVVKSAASSLSTHALVGSFVGLALGAFLAYRLRQNRRQMFDAFRAAEKPTHVKFADGREQAIPDLTPMLRPTTVGDVAAYTLFGFGGIFLGGEAGLLTGSWSARSTINQDAAVRERVEKAFRSFRADVLRKEIQQLEGGKATPWTF